MPNDNIEKTVVSVLSCTHNATSLRFIFSLRCYNFFHSSTTWFMVFVKSIVVLIVTVILTVTVILELGNV